MREMIYQSEFKKEILASGYCFGLLYYILSLGTHPTAYVKIPADHKYYKKGYEEIDIAVHGGITYINNELYISEKEKLEGWFIGWDYAHCDDYMGFYEKLSDTSSLKHDNKKWTTKEILRDVRNVCYQLRKRGGECKNIGALKIIRTTKRKQVEKASMVLLRHK